MSTSIEYYKKGAEINNKECLNMLVTIYKGFDEIQKIYDLSVIELNCPLKIPHEDNLQKMLYYEAKLKKL